MPSVLHLRLAGQVEPFFNSAKRLSPPHVPTAPPQQRRCGTAIGDRFSNAGCDQPSPQLQARRPERRGSPQPSGAERISLEVWSYSQRRQYLTEVTRVEPVMLQFFSESGFNFKIGFHSVSQTRLSRDIFAASRPADARRRPATGRASNLGLSQHRLSSRLSPPR